MLPKKVQLMYIPNDDTQSFPFCKLQLFIETFGHSLNESTNQNSLKVPKVVKPTNQKTLLKTLETSVICSPLSLTFL